MRLHFFRTMGWVIAVCVVAAACGGGPDAAALGQAVEVSHTDPETNDTAALSVTVKGVRQGSVEELEKAGLQFDADERALVPHYVDVEYTNTGDTPATRTMRVGLEDAEENLISATVVLDFAQKGGKGGPCPDIDDGELPPGESFEDCTLFLVPPDAEVARVSFLSQPAGGEPEFVYWQVQ